MVMTHKERYTCNIYIISIHVGATAANLELVPTLLKLRRAGTIIFHVKIVFAYHAKLVK
jgi:hypothetical protein